MFREAKKMFRSHREWNAPLNADDQEVGFSPPARCWRARIAERMVAQQELCANRCETSWATKVLPGL